MPGNMFRRQVLPFYLWFAALAVATLAIDAVLHLADVVWIGRYLGIPGVALIIGSFGYSLRKRKITTKGDPAKLLRRHERYTWAGALLVMVHAGIHFNAILPWLAVVAMLINVASGLTGKYLIARARARLADNTRRLRAEGLAEADIEARLYWDSLTFDAVKQWRLVHFPITLAFGVLALAHLIAVFLFWGWH